MTIALVPGASGMPESDSLWRLIATSDMFRFGGGQSVADILDDARHSALAVPNRGFDPTPRWSAPLPGDDAHFPTSGGGDNERGTPSFGTNVVGRTYSPSIDGLLSGVKWNSLTITYSNPDSTADYQAGYPTADLKNFQTIGAHQLYAAHAALNSASVLPGQLGGAGFAIEGFTNLGIDYAGQGSGAGTLRLANNSNSNTAYAYFPAATDTGGDIWFGPSGRGPEAGNYDYLTLLHEIGHALGLKHGHEAGGYGAMPYDTDSMEFSVMTYRSYVGQPISGYSNENWGYAQSYMMYDIAALQHMYGADFSTNDGNTVYSWDPNSGRTLVDGQTAVNAGGNRIFLTIWDGGGTDTYDLSKYTTDLSIDLNPGGYSTFSRAQLAYLGGGSNGGDARGNVFNALQYHGDSRSLIENATGGSGNDDMLGNAANNVLRGNAGNDDLTGFAGNDTLLGGDGNDWIDGHVGSDQMYGGAGDDIYYVDDALDIPIEDSRTPQEGGVDLVFSYISHTLGFGLDKLSLISSGAVNGTGNDLGNALDGGGGANVLRGLAGGDLLQGFGGADSLFGGDGNDRLSGGAGADLLVGGRGSDVFDFDSVADSAPGARDVCRSGDGGPAFDGAGAAAGDRIDLAGIDANTTAGGNQAFAFGGAGLGRVSAVNLGADTLIHCNIDKDAAFEFELLIQDGGVQASAYQAGDFFL